jgi:hypothetical protein
MFVSMPYRCYLKSDAGRRASDDGDWRIWEAMLA